MAFTYINLAFLFLLLPAIVSMFISVFGGSSSLLSKMVRSKIYVITITVLFLCTVEGTVRNYLTPSKIDASTQNGNKSMDTGSIIEAFKIELDGDASLKGYDEYEEARKIGIGDFDGDNDEDAIIQYTMEPGPAIGGNAYHFAWMVFKNIDGKPKHWFDHSAGGKLSPSDHLESIKKGIIYASHTEYAEADPSCCPSIKSKARYRVYDSKIVEAR